MKYSNDDVIKFLDSISTEEDYLDNQYADIDQFDSWELKQIPIDQLDFSLENVSDPDSQELIKKYSEIKTESPPIIAIPSETEEGLYRIVDGYHRVAVVFSRGDKTVQAYVPVVTESIDEATNLDKFTFKKWFKQWGPEDEMLRLALGLNPHDLSVPTDPYQAEKWFNQRKRDVSKMLAQATEGNEVVVFRCMEVSPQWIEKVKAGEKVPLGHHWTISKDLAPFLCHGTGGKIKQDNVILKASVPKNDIDIDNLFNPAWTEDLEAEEAEVGLKKNKIKLLSVYSSDMKTEIAQPNSLFPVAGYSYQNKESIDESSEYTLDVWEGKLRKAIREEYWGKVGAGGLFYAEDTGRYLFAHRSSHVDQPDTWGTWGGRIETNESPEEALKREAEEESGYSGPMKIKEVSVYKDGDFKFHNFIMSVPQEFEPVHSWETQGHLWTTLDQLPSPLHFGVKEMLKHLQTNESIYEAKKKPPLKEKEVSIKGGLKIYLKLILYPGNSLEKDNFYIEASFGHAREKIGTAEIHSTAGVGWNKNITVANVSVDNSFRRKGIATAMYDYAEEITGKTLVPWEDYDGGEEPMSRAGKEFWKNRTEFNESLSDWKGTWVHYSEIPEVKINPKQFHQDPTGIYLFPESFKPEGSWFKFPYKFKVATTTTNVLDVSTLTKESAIDLMKKMVPEEFHNSYIEEINKSSSPIDTWWEMLKNYFVLSKEAPGKASWAKAFRNQGYDSIFDDTGSIFTNEVQLIVLDPSKVKVLERIDQKESGFKEVQDIAQWLAKYLLKYGQVEVTAPKKQKPRWGEPQPTIQAEVRVDGPNKKYLSFDIKTRFHDKKDSVPSEISVSLSGGAWELKTQRSIGKTFQWNKRPWDYSDLGKEVDMAAESEFGVKESNESIKTPKVPEDILSYIRGEGSAVDTRDKEIIAYKKAIYPLLKKSFGKTITVYRTFSYPEEIDWDGNINPEDMALSYSDSKSFALALANERREDDANDWIYVIQVKLPIEQIYFHHAFDLVGKEHPNEKEVIAMAAGAETKIIKEIPPVAKAEAIEEKKSDLQFEFEDEEDGFTILASKDGKDAGNIFVTLEFIDSDCYTFSPYEGQPFHDKICDHERVVNIQHLKVEKEFQGQGIATELMKRGAKEIKKRYGGVPVYINASPMDGPEGISLENLVKFYQKFGFKMLKKYPKYRNALLWKESLDKMSALTEITKERGSKYKMFSKKIPFPSKAIDREKQINDFKLQKESLDQLIESTQTKTKNEDEEYVFRGTSGIEPEVLMKKPKFQGDGIFGPGTYFAINEENARSYIDSNTQPAVLGQYKVSGEILYIEATSPKNGFYTYGKVDLEALGVSEKLKKKSLKRPEELGEAVLEAGYHAVVVTGYVDGGDQLFVPWKSRAKVSLIDYDIIGDVRENTLTHHETPLDCKLNRAKWFVNLPLKGDANFGEAKDIDSDFRYGLCGTYAMALHDLTGKSLGMIYGEKDDESINAHSFVFDSPETLIDVQGKSNIKDVIYNIVIDYNINHPDDKLDVKDFKVIKFNDKKEFIKYLKKTWSPEITKQDYDKAVKTIKNKKQIKESVQDGPQIDDFLQSRIHAAFTKVADDLCSLGYMDSDERIKLSSAIGDSLESFRNAMDEKCPWAKKIKVEPGHAGRLVLESIEITPRMLELIKQIPDAPKYKIKATEKAMTSYVWQHIGTIEKELDTLVNMGLGEWFEDKKVIGKHFRFNLPAIKKYLEPKESKAGAGRLVLESIEELDDKKIKEVVKFFLTIDPLVFRKNEKEFYQRLGDDSQGMNFKRLLTKKFSDYAWETGLNQDEKIELAKRINYGPLYMVIAKRISPNKRNQAFPELKRKFESMIS